MIPTKCNVGMLMPAVHTYCTNFKKITLSKTPRQPTHLSSSGEQKESQDIKPSKYSYAQAANSTLKTINFHLNGIKDCAILDSGATSYFLVTDVSATGISNATNPITVTIPDGSKLTSTHE